MWCVNYFVGDMMLGGVLKEISYSDYHESTNIRLK